MVLGTLAAINRCQGDAEVCLTKSCLGLHAGVLAGEFWILEEYPVAAPVAAGEP